MPVTINSSRLYVHAEQVFPIATAQWQAAARKLCEAYEGFESPEFRSRDGVTNRRRLRSLGEDIVIPWRAA